MEYTGHRWSGALYAGVSVAYYQEWLRLYTAMGCRVLGKDYNESEFEPGYIVYYTRDTKR